MVTIDNAPPAEVTTTCAVAVVEPGKKVKKGQTVGRVDAGKLGADVHSSIDGKVRAVTADWIEIASEPRA